MKFLKNIPLLFILGIALAFVACDKKNEVEETEYRVEVSILAPTEGVTITAGEAFTVNVMYSRESDLIHNVFVAILDQDDKVVQELLNQHAHQQGNYEFNLEGVKISEAGNYQLKAYTTDMTDHGEQGHSGNEPEDHNMKKINFTVQ